VLWWLHQTLLTAHDHAQGVSCFLKRTYIIWHLTEWQKFKEWFWFMEQEKLSLSCGSTVVPKFVVCLYVGNRCLLPSRPNCWFASRYVVYQEKIVISLSQFVEAWARKYFLECWNLCSGLDSRWMHSELDKLLGWNTMWKKSRNIVGYRQDVAKTEEDLEKMEWICKLVSRDLTDLLIWVIK